GMVTGNGDVVQPTDGVAAIGSGGNYATAAAKALLAHSNLSAAEIVKEALKIASEIDIYTNSNIIVEELK
ncbi:MAG: HslU--HslV peptidase proteolytic subunit, partial [Thermoguttaceae bacterium]|nr:HslU--HslV peptidase proteolytic subunit [Thermoguttaceae bacterium]